MKLPSTRNEQLAALVPHFNDALRVIRDELLDSRSELFILALERLQDGVATFGNQMFGHSVDRLSIEADEELADAIVYVATILYKAERE